MTIIIIIVSNIITTIMIIISSNIISNIIMTIMIMVIYREASASIYDLIGRPGGEWGEDH